MSNTKLTEAVRKQIIALKADGKSLNEISILTKVSKRSVSVALADHKAANPVTGDPVGITYIGKDDLEITGPAGDTSGDIDKMITDADLSTTDWEVTHVKLNEWEFPSQDGIQKLHQRKVSLTRKKPELDVYQLFRPVDLKPVMLPPGKARPDRATTLAFIFGDNQHRLHDRGFQDCRHQWVAAHQPDICVDVGDGTDNGKMATHPPKPTDSGIRLDAASYVNEELYPLACLVPNAKKVILPCNHLAQRWEAYVMRNAPEVWGLSPVDVPGLAKDEEPLWSIKRLLRTEEMGWEYLMPAPGQHYGDISFELIPGELQVIHGDLTGKTAGEQYIKAFNTSVIFGHLHKKSYAITDVSRRGALKSRILMAIGIGCGMDRKKAGYTAGPDWQNSALSVSIFPDGTWTFSEMNYDPETRTMTWQDEVYTARNPVEVALGDAA